MSAALLDATVAFVRAAYTKQQLATVDAYGGQFTADEAAQVSFNCPAVFVTVLGWTPTTESRRLTGHHVREVTMAAFVVAKHADRTQRMRLASLLAESLALRLRQWVPDSTDTMALAPLEEDAAAENMFGRAIDKKGLALWLVRWQQCVQPTQAPEALADLLAIDITDLTRPGQVPAAPAVPPAVMVVSEDVQFPVG